MREHILSSPSEHVDNALAKKENLKNLYFLFSFFTFLLERDK